MTYHLLSPLGAKDTEDWYIFDENTENSKGIQDYGAPYGAWGAPLGQNQAFEHMREGPRGDAGMQTE